MAVDTKLRKVPFDSQLEQKINDHSNSAELIGYQLVSSFLSPVVDGKVYVFLIFQKRS
jgi:hypothetical protein